MHLVEVKIKNFKSIKEQNLNLTKNAVLIGPNASGKTNILEFFKFMKLALTDVAIPYNPFSDWWGFQNVVFKKDVRKNIGGSFRFDVEQYRVNYEINIGIDPLGQLTIVYEKLEVPGFYEIERTNQLISFRYDLNYLEKIRDLLPIETSFQKFDVENLERLKKPVKINVDERRPHVPLFDVLTGWSGSYSDDLAIMNLNQLDVDVNDTRLNFVFPMLRSKNKKDRLDAFRDGPLFSAVNFRIQEFFRKITFLKHPDLRAIRKPLLPSRQIILNEDGSNLNEILYQWFIKDRKFPDVIEQSIKREFSNSSIRFDLTQDGRILLVVKENELELQPHSVSDGFYKLLFILTALETKPSLLLIDEIENSLHKDLIELLVDTINLSGTQSIVSTHSPLIVDMFELDQLRVITKDLEQTSIDTPKDIRKLKQQLQDLGLAHSDAWYEGVLSSKS